MRDFPIFDTEYGVSSLVLREIPYKKEAYICIRDVQKDYFADHLRECVAFCKMAGAERVYASGSEALAEYPLFTTVVQMRKTWMDHPENTAHLFPVSEKTAAEWRRIYNRRMQAVPNSRTLEQRDEKQLLEENGAYFIHDDGLLLGIGWLKEEKLLAIASVVPGSGERLIHTMMGLVQEGEMVLEVSLDNHRAVKLYERMGFIPTCEIVRWYDVTN